MSGPYIEARPSNPGLEVLLPSGATIRSTHIACTLDLPSLPLAARQCHLFPDLASGSLLSIGQLCDHGCHTHFDATSVMITCTVQRRCSKALAPSNQAYRIPHQSLPLLCPCPLHSCPSYNQVVVPCQEWLFLPAPLLSIRWHSIMLQCYRPPVFPSGARQLMLVSLPHRLTSPPLKCAVISQSPHPW